MGETQLRMDIHGMYYLAEVPDEEVQEVVAEAVPKDKPKPQVLAEKKDATPSKGRN